MREVLEADHVKRHKEETKKVRKRVEAYHNKKIVEAVEQARDEILNNSSTGSTNDTSSDLSIPILMSK